MEEVMNEDLIEINAQDLFIINGSILENLAKIQLEVGYRDFKIEKYRIDNYLNQLTGSCFKLSNLLSGDEKLELTEEEAELSMNFHTFLRKGMDSDEATILWHWINKDYAKKTYNRFIKKLNNLIILDSKKAITMDTIVNLLKKDEYESFDLADFEFKYIIKNIFSKEDGIHLLNELKDYSSYCRE